MNPIPEQSIRNLKEFVLHCHKQNLVVDFKPHNDRCITINIWSVKKQGTGYCALYKTDKIDFNELQRGIKFIKDQEIL